MAKYIDMSNWDMSEHGIPDSNIIVIKKATKEEKLNNGLNNNGTYWWCKCKNHPNTKSELLNGALIRKGRIKNCSCCNSQKRTEYIDMSGWILAEHNYVNNPIQIVKRSDKYTKGHTIYWECCCTKHPNQKNFISSRESILKNNCYACPICKSEHKYINMTNWIMSEHGYPNSNIKVIRPASQEEQSHYITRAKYWWCQCLKHPEHPLEMINGQSLRAGITQNCSCCQVKSKGEELIVKILEKNNILYEREKYFNNLYYEDTNRPVRFDFYINNLYCLEFDGKQHFSYSTNKGWNTKEQLIKTQNGDQLRNEYCKQNNIPLIRIPYTHLNDLCLEDLLLETTSFRYC